MSDEQLCCCEYYSSVSGERKHIIECCCDCEAFDKACDDCCFRCKFDMERCNVVASVINDRCRLPRQSGARRIRLELVLLVLSLPSLLFIGALHWILTFVCVFILIPAFTVLAFRCSRNLTSRSSFFYQAAWVSSVTCYISFATLVASFRAVFLWEHLLLNLLFVICAAMVVRVRRLSDSALILPGVAERSSPCKSCGHNYMVRDHHCVWLDCCVNAANHRAFLCTLVLGVVTGCYGLHLTMTTICTPSIYMDLFLYPADCRFLYSDILHGVICSTSSLVVLALVFLSQQLLVQILLISQNITMTELRKAYKDGRVFLGLIASSNTHSHGICKNWLDFLLNQRS